jgi:hypothetical protein
VRSPRQFNQYSGSGLNSRGSYRRRGMDFPLRFHIWAGSGAHCASNSRILGVLSPGERQPGTETGHSPLPRAYVMMRIFSSVFSWRSVLKRRGNFTTALLCHLLFGVAVVSAQFELAPKRAGQSVKRFNLKCCDPVQTKPHLTAQLPWHREFKFAGSYRCSLGKSDYVENLYLFSVWKIT